MSSSPTHDVWTKEAARPDTADLFSAEMEKALSAGVGWSSESERQAYLDKVTADDYLPAIFCSTPEELANAPDGGAFEGLLFDNETAAGSAQRCKERGNEKVRLGQGNLAGNVQYYREAVDAYAEAVGWCGRVVCTDDEGFEQAVHGRKEDCKDDGFREFTRGELEGYEAVLRSNAAVAHLALKNWGFAAREAGRAVELDGGLVKGWYRLGAARKELKK